MTEEQLNSSAEIEFLKKSNRELEEKNKKLEELQMIQGDLFKMIIHDLKGPIGEIEANLDLLKYDKSLSEINREYLDTAIMGCKNLYRMVLNILEVGKMEEGRMTLNKKSFRIHEIVEDSIKKVNTVANQNKTCVIMEIEENLKPVNADWEIISRVFSNLLLNAISYSPPQSEIKIIAEQGEREGFLTVRVVDQGEGIPEELRKKIFDKFCQDVKNGDRRQYSTGLGLTFCKMAIEAHNGIIGVESEEGKGSTFVFTLPTIT